MHPIIREKIPDIPRIAARYRVKRLGVFGSATGDRFNPRASDIDFVVEFEPMTPVEHAGAYFGLAEEPAALFCRKIDLVELSAIRNPIFCESVEENLQGCLCCRVR